MDKKRKINTIIGYCVFATLIALLFVARFMYGTIINVDGVSMYPTFQDGGFVFATMLHDNDTVQTGDVVILEEEGLYLIKRIHAAPGESTRPDVIKGIPALTMGEDEYYVLGDNWENSRDSRYFGAISRSDIKFKFSGLYWTRPQMILGVFIPLILFIASLTIALIPAEKDKRRKTNKNTDEDTENEENESTVEDENIFECSEAAETNVCESVESAQEENAVESVDDKSSILESTPIK